MRPLRLRAGCRAVVALGMALAAFAAALPAIAAEPALDGAMVDYLMRRIDERDARIADLMRRVQALERERAGLRTASTPPEAKPRIAAAPAVSEATALKVAAAQTAQAGSASGAKHASPPGQFAVDPEAVDRALERTLVQAGALLLPFGAIEVQPSLSYSRAQVGAPVLLLNGSNTVVGTAQSQTSTDVLDGIMTVRVGLPLDAQLDAAVPYRRISSSRATNVGGTVSEDRVTDIHGLGDVAVGLSKTVLKGHGGWPNLFAAVSWNSDTAETKNGRTLGSGFNEITGTLTATRRQDPLVFVGAASYTAAVDSGTVEPGDTLGFSLGTVMAVTPRPRSGSSSTRASSARPASAATPSRARTPCSPT